MIVQNTKPVELMKKSQDKWEHKLDGLRYLTGMMEQKGLGSDDERIKLLNTLLLGDTDAKQYLRELYEDTPIFDEIPPEFGKRELSESHWEHISKYLLSPIDKEMAKMLAYIVQGDEYKMQMNNKDSIVR